jgi:hypothetical protein
MQPEVEQPKKKELTAIEQWDMLAFKVIGNELVPKGFKTQKNGKYRGTEYAEVPKKAVVRTQKIAAQLVRGYRDKLRKAIDEQISAGQMFSKTCKWWQFVLKRELNATITNLEKIKSELDKVDIK